jgi:CRISPR-associated protein Csx10
MELLKIKIEALSPLAFPIRKPGPQYRSSQPFVPGATLYGALGEYLARRAEYSPELFQALRCHNAYPSKKCDQWVRPRPITALQPKNKPDEMKDSLIERICWELQEPSALIYAPTDSGGRPWEAAGLAFYASPSNSESRIREVQQHIVTRVSINQALGTADDGRLYSFFAINEADKEGNPTRFQGSLVCPDQESAEQVRRALSQISYIGGRQHSGVGHVAISAEGGQEAETAADLQTRIGQFNHAIREQAELYQRLGGKALDLSRPFFTVNLLSHAILLEDGWQPTSELSAASLEELTGIDAQLVRSFSSTEIVGGWNQLWKRPKPTQLAVRMGSVFLFQAEQALQDRDYQELARLQLSGIGERRPEGYGQVRICDEFHLSFIGANNERA